MRRLFKVTSLRFQAVAAISALIILTSAILVGALIKSQKENMMTELKKRGESLIKLLANNCEYGVMVESDIILKDLMKTLAFEKDFVFVTVQNMQGDLIASVSTPDQPIDLPSLLETNIAQQLKLKQVEVNIRNVDQLNSNLMQFTYPVFKYTIEGGVSREELGNVQTALHGSNVKAEPIGLARLGISLKQLEKDISRMVWMTIILTTLVVMAAIVLTITMVNFKIKPIENIVSVTERIASGDLSNQVPVKSTDEIARLAISFNKMTDSLQKYRHEVEMYNRTLEQKIAERTRELDNAQDQLIQSEKMAAIGQLAAGVAHELNNPMGGILGYSQYALEKLSKKKASEMTDGDIESQCRFLGDIEQQARRCKEIVKNLLKFSRTSSKENFEMFNLNEAINETLTFVQHQLDMKNIELNKELDSELPNYFGNESQLQQVFTNLIINAEHAMKEGGKLTIATRFAKPVGEFAGCVEVEFTDSGCGIPPEILNKIFEPFYTTKEVGKGTGLGLSISYGIIKEHQGDILVKSKVGEGTTFMLVLPLDKTENSEAAPQSETEENETRDTKSPSSSLNISSDT